MTFLKHDPSRFAMDAAAGFAEIYADVVAPVPGGVVRATRGSADQVALVIGGGSGHYPAFAGLVGPGLAHAAVLGNIFASPSSHQIEAVAKVADQGRGVLFSYGNYAGDALQFDAAARRLEASGVPVRTVRVTDDIFSAPPEETERRRGIAGDLVVFKIAGAAAARGDDLEQVFAYASRANARTRSMGVAFSGCSLPGSDEPLFTVPKGRMAVGLGIHGEPGIEEREIPTPEGLAELFVDTLLHELPYGADKSEQRVVLILNGLGAFKADEMFVVYLEMRKQLESAGVVLAESQVGEFCTSFEMAGLSATLFWLDKELEELWLAPAQTPAYASGHVGVEQIHLDLDTEVRPPEEVSSESSSPESQAAVSSVVEIFETIVDCIEVNKDELGRLDAVAGDGDHGLGMLNGAQAALLEVHRAAEEGVGARTALRRAAISWSDGGGGTSGALWYTILESIAAELDDVCAPSGAALRRGIRRAADSVMLQGGANVGDKTLVDALSPFADELTAGESTQTPFGSSWRSAAAAAERGAESTVGMMPGLGRSRTHGARARDVPDPGAVSFSQIVHAVASLFDATNESS